MQQKGFHRKLSAILSADVAGYSRLMQDDEASTVTTLESHKQAFSDLIRQHRGRVVDSTGDNLLAEFASVVDAVQCAVAVQKGLQARNAELPEDRRMLFRIGVNLGDVIEEGERIFGDGVNIAARLQSLADPGGICVSKTAFDHIESKLPLGYEFLGEQTVKNITKPVGAGDQKEGDEFQRSGFRAEDGRYRCSRRSAGGFRYRDLAGFSEAAGPSGGGLGEGRSCEDGAAAARATVDRGPSVREPQRGPETATSLRRGHRQRHKRPVQGASAVRHRPQFDVYLQGEECSSEAGERGTRRAVRSGRQRAAVGRPGPDHRADGRCAQR